MEIPIEYQRLFDSDWREAAVYGGRYCFDGDTIISMYDGSFKRISDIVVGDKVLSLVGDYDIVNSIDSFEANFEPKPMFELEINGTITKTTYDHKYFNGKTYIPIYQLVWGIMDSSQKRTLELLCKQYGEDTNNELQGWLQNKSDETINQPQRLFNDSCRKKVSSITQNNSKNIYSELEEKGNSQSQKRNKNRQQSKQLGVGDKTGTIHSSLEDGVKDRPIYTGKEFKEDNRERSQRIATISLTKSKDANKNDGRTSKEQDWIELRWDKGFAKWENLETLTGRLPSQETNTTGSKKGRIRVKKVYESVDVWSIETEKYHNYFANGVNVSNSMKSHTVARVLLIKAREKKIRIGCFREFQNSIAESSHQLLSDLIKQYGLNDFSITDKTITNKITGSDFIFKGLWNNEQSLKSIEGINIAWIEEAQTITKKSLEVLTPTIREVGSQLIYTYNRLNVSDPVHTRLVEEGRPNTLIINVNYDIAEKYGFLPDVIKKEIEDDKLKRPVLYKQKWLGEPYVSPNDKLSTLALTKCLTPETNSQENRVVIGVDTGHDIYYTLMNKQGVFYHGYCQSPQEVNDPDYDPYDEIDKLLYTNPNWILVADQGGDLIGIRKLQTKYKGRVFLVWFVKETKSKQLIRWGENDEHGKVLVDRNRTIQLAVDQLNEQRIMFNGSSEDWQPFFEHCLNVYRVKEISGKDENDPQYGWRWVWKRKGADHWFMSLIYALVGMDKFSEDLAQIINKKDNFMEGVETASSSTGVIQAGRLGIKANF